MYYVPAVTLLLVAVAPAVAPAVQAQAQGQSQSGAPKPARPRARAAPVAIMQSGPEIGRRAADFTLRWASKDSVGPVEAPYQLWGDLGKTVVLVFFPRAFTKSSTAEMRTLTEQYDALFGPDVVVAGISTDPPDTQNRFAAEVGIPFRLLSDEGQKVAKKYGTSDSNGFIRRSIYVIGTDGKVKYRNMRFDPFDSKAYAAIGKAVRSTGSSD